MASITWLSRWRHLFGLLVLYQWTIVCSSDSQVTQSPVSQNVQEGGLFAIICSNPNEYRTHFWYRQQPGRAPTFLLYIASQEKNETKGRFTADLNTKEKFTSLTLHHTQVGDSLVYFCAESRSAAKTHPASHKTCCQGSHSEKHCFAPKTTTKNPTTSRLAEFILSLLGS
uniref:Ig-like domain-containing protein n=1 Tax=Podarcis muralis TaxID=64176 RepID=A0A670JBG6_PODMU